MEFEGTWTLLGSKRRLSHIYQEKEWVKKWSVSNDGVQDRLSQSTAPWHIPYFKLKEFEKTAEAEDSLTCHTSALK